jgi:hypothetical protein
VAVFATPENLLLELSGIARLSPSPWSACRFFSALGGRRVEFWLGVVDCVRENRDENDGWHWFPFRKWETVYIDSF